MSPLLLLCLVSLAFAQTTETGSTSNVTEVYCPNDCNNRAPPCDPIERPTCQCVFGFGGDDCSETVAQEIPGAWYTFRFFLVFSYGLCTIIGVYAFVYGSHGGEKDANSANDLTFFFNVRKSVLITLITLSFETTLYHAIDPQGFELIFPFVVLQLTFGIVFVLLSILYTLVLFHWAEIYFTTIKVLKREEYLEKINSKYESNVTLDTVLTNIKFLNKIKIPFLVINIIAFILQVVRDVWYGVTVNPGNPFSLPWLVGMLLIYIVEGVGFLIFGRKLLKVLPEPLQKKMKKITMTLVITTFLFLGAFLYTGIAFIFIVRGAWTFLITEIIWRGMMLAIVVFILSLFVKLKKSFPFVDVGHTQSSRNVSSYELETA